LYLVLNPRHIREIRVVFVVLLRPISR
jgi:hypothetical protein